MKKVSILILIAAFLFPVFGHAATAPAKTTVQDEATDLNSPLLQGKTLSAKKIAVQTALNDIYTQLAKLSLQTQSAINQLNDNGVATMSSQTALIAANTSLTKAKNDIASFGAVTISNTKYSSFTLDIMKNTANTAEASLREAKAHLLDSLTALKATLPQLDTDN